MLWARTMMPRRHSLALLLLLPVPCALTLVEGCGSDGTAASSDAGVLDGSTSDDAASDAAPQSDSGADDASSGGDAGHDGGAGGLWARQFGTAANDYAVSVAEDANGNLFVAGNVGAALPSQTYVGGADAFVRKYDSTGKEIWTRQFGSTKDDFVNGVKLDSSGNVIVAGYTRDVLTGQTSAGNNDAFVRKYDGAGTLVWTRQFGSSSFDSANALAVDSSGDIFVVGAANAALPSQASAGGNDAFVRKYDSAGTELWTKQFGSSGEDVAIDVAVDSSGGVIVTGYAIGALPTQSYAGSNDVFVRKYDSGGNELWTSEFGSAASDIVTAATVDTAGNVLITGYTAGALSGQASSGKEDAFVRKYDSTGSALWTKQAGTADDDHGTAIFANAAGDVWVGGTTAAAASVQDSAFLWKFDGAGTAGPTKTITPLSSQILPRIVDGTGHVILVGFVNGTYPGQSALGQSDALLVKGSF